MALKTISESDFLDAALDLFRTRGFAGVSLSQLSEATGLEKASLYYRYPGGKGEIIMAVVNRVVAWFQVHVFAPLQGEEIPRRRVSIVAEQLRLFYHDGTKPCITDVLSLSGGSEELAVTLKIAVKAWMKAFSDIAREGGMSAAVARVRAEEAVIRIEGSLVIARVLGDKAPFQRTIKLLPDLLTEV